MQYNYWCIDCSCNKNAERDYVISSDDEIDAQMNQTVRCISNNSVLKFMGVYNSTVIINANKHKFGRVNKEKEKRRISYIKKELIPTIPKLEQKHFNKKHDL